MPSRRRASRRRLPLTTTPAETLEYRLCLTEVVPLGEPTADAKPTEVSEPDKKDMHGWDTRGMHAKTKGLHIARPATREHSTTLF
ncbi:MAG: hypothetical protein AB8G99_03560, partial [Planctomycetaceae bacterium]